ncbi:DEAD/DEAH box helicase [Salinibacterium sp. G-O1]|uniref:DUF3427 domain-containing protein n=1 Tax=Salinibacterium sp. G-O1 TaxID=3046208 RepID=UPI0024BBAD58|nr:DEAD/DEAH box helicase [Salinibacterium sp. G-O1]MDJ0334368.1 DEAD/DEAH box helicase [Salinibacterium sp. G-O1]
MTVDLNDLEPFGRDIGFGYLDKSVHSPREFQPNLVLNSANDSVLRALRYELKHASSFTFSVAFVSTAAIALLKQDLIDFAGVGRIITSDYLGFNSPQALAELLNLNRLGVDVRMHSDPAFHAKGYVFHRPQSVTAILGSANLTAGAITRNHEWNLRVSASRDSDLAEQFTNLLDEGLDQSSPLTQQWIDDYATRFTPPVTTNRHTARHRARRESLSAPEPPATEIVPNAMQTEALTAIARVRETGKSRALIVSATGTGKTILSALDVRSVGPKRMLFVAHREQILDRAIHEFRRVLGGDSDRFGKLAGSTRQSDRQFVFATIQTLSQQHVLDQLDPDAFDYVLIDEVHRAGAASFDRVLNHFRPKFLLGMTATPERPDGVNIFELFDYNVPYEIRLKSALELNMLSPFHYYGVADVTFVDGQTTTDGTSLARLVGAERVEHILGALNTYGQAGVAPRGLIFCSRKEEAHELSSELNRRVLHGSQLRTIALTGDDSIEDRERAVERLEEGELDYILTVDIFNEGVDIPSINQVVMLRQTQSSIVFVQQLGRGLRHAPGKRYLVVIDFIGNYENNYLIPIALFGDQSLNKESLRKNLIAAQEVGVIAGLSSVRFDRVAQERVLRSLASSKIDSFQNLKAAIETIRNRVGRTPMLLDFVRFDTVDPIILATKVGNYPLLVSKLFKEESGLSADQSSYLSVITRELLTAKRPHELALLKLLISGGTQSRESIVDELSRSGLQVSDSTVSSAIRSLALSFNTASEKHQFRIDRLAYADAEGGARLDDTFARYYRDSAAFQRNVDDAIETGLALINERYLPDRPFTPGMQYSRKDASRLLNWSSNMYSTIYGYRVDQSTFTCPIFVTLHKSDEVAASTAYEDELLDPRTFLWYSKSKRTLTSPDVQPIVQNAVELHVFAKKSDAEGSDFYYLGRARSADAEQTTMPASDGKPLSVVRMHLGFEEAVSPALFDYFHSTFTSGSA